MCGDLLDYRSIQLDNSSYLVDIRAIYHQFYNIIQ